MTTVDSQKLRELVKRMHTNSLAIQEANQLNDPSYCVGWRGATNTYAIELLALVDREASAQHEPVQIHVQLQNVASIEHVGALAPGSIAAVSVDGEEWPKCIDCGAPCSPERDPLRCLVCQLDKDIAAPEHQSSTVETEIPGIRIRTSRNTDAFDEHGQPRMRLTPTADGMKIEHTDRYSIKRLDMNALLSPPPKGGAT